MEKIAPLAYWEVQHRPPAVSAGNLIHVRDQEIFVDRGAGASLSSDAVLLKIDRFG